MTTSRPRRQTTVASSGGKVKVRHSATRTISRKPTKSKPATTRTAGARAAFSAKPRERPETKKALVITMLRDRGGTTIAAIADATGWQQHTVRGFFAGVVRKKLGFDMVSDATESGRVYRITERTTSTAAAMKDHAA